MRSPEAAPARLAQLSPDLLGAVLIDERGELVACTEPDSERALELADLALELLEATDRISGRSPQQIEAQVEGGAVYVARGTRYALAVVARRLALPALVLYDMRMALREIESTTAGQAPSGRAEFR